MRIQILIRSLCRHRHNSDQRLILERFLSICRLVTGGSIDGQMRAAEKNLARVTDKTVVISGHGRVGGKTDLTVFRDVLVLVRDKVMVLKKSRGDSYRKLSPLNPARSLRPTLGTGFHQFQRIRRVGVSGRLTIAIVLDVCAMEVLKGDFSMAKESQKIDGQQRVEFTPDFLGESRHEFVAKLAYQYWERRGMPLGSPEVDWFAAERALYESLVASGSVSPFASSQHNMQ